MVAEKRGTFCLSPHIVFVLARQLFGLRLSKLEANC